MTEKLDRWENPYLYDTYFELTPAERVAHFNTLGEAIAGHKVAYYLKTPTINDAEYDYLERYYEAVADDLGLEPVAVNSVGYKIEEDPKKET